jgi:hypothetical protein
VADVTSRITLTLEGEHAKKGVSLDAFENFVDHFISALRYHYRASIAAPVKKTGRPFSKEEIATAFRLVEFKVGSGIAVLEPPLRETDEAAPFAEVPTLAWENLADLLQAVESQRKLEEPVVNELEKALKSLGTEGRFSVEFRDANRVRAQVFDPSRLAALRPPPDEKQTRPQIITGVLHAIDLEPDKVAIRTAGGIDWTCRYTAELEHDVLSLIGKRVWARGIGKLTSSRSGVLEIIEIHGVPEHEQTSLFTSAPLPVSELMDLQGVQGPQGLRALTDPEWVDNEESDLFLEALLDNRE